MKKQILISFIGNNDCKLSEGQEGAVIRILREKSFDKLYIMYNHDRYLKGASDTLLYCRKHFPKLEIVYQPAITLDPIDYNLVYPSMVEAIKNILEQEENNLVEYTISVTSGTPTMHSCWILIAQGGIITAKLIQVSRERGISDISFKLDDFPHISNEKMIKVQLTKTSRENTFLKSQLTTNFDDIIGSHSSILELKQNINSLVKYDIPIFINGESGTGKEVVARIVHYNSARKEHPFIPVNCGAISEKLFESEFFGHKKGAFTGAIADYDGYFGQADKGTLFLDEIGDLPPQMQVKLLRVLETGVIQPVGGKAKSVNVRILSASNKDLRQMTAEGSFREDLFYRIVQGQINLSPLRDRGSDIILLAKHFLKFFNRKNQTYKRFYPSSERKLLDYHYPGNVRELKSIVDNSCIYSQNDEIMPNDISFFNDIAPRSNIHIPPEGVDLDNEIIPSYYQAALAKAKGNAAEAARLLNLEPHTFRARLKTHSTRNRNNPIRLVRNEETTS